MNIKNYFNDLLKNKKIFYYLLIMLLTGVLIILVSDITSSLAKKKAEQNKTTVEVSTNAVISANSSNYEDRIKKELTETLSQISGVGRVSLMIYFEGGSITVPGMNVNDTNKKTEEKDSQGGTRVTTENTKSQSVVILNEGGDNKPLVLRQVNPVIGGVIVVAEGAEKSEIKEKLQTAVKITFNIPSSKVIVMPMKK
jgi:stage III sporulation protein AG